eukprot:20415-Heterococcus_DN1.PRE.5
MLVPLQRHFSSSSSSSSAFIHHQEQYTACVAGVPHVSFRIDNRQKEKACNSTAALQHCGAAAAAEQ